jgi:hypothetical protein
MVIIFLDFKLSLCSVEGSETSANINQTLGIHPKIETVKVIILRISDGVWLWWTTAIIYTQCCIEAIPLQACTGPEVSRRLRLRDFKTIGTWRWQGCQPYAPPPLPPGIIPGTNSSWGTRWRSWLRHCATRRKVESSTPDVMVSLQFFIYIILPAPLWL